MVLSTDWTQLEVIDLINDGTGLGFGIIGGRSTGVVVKTVLPGGIADQDGHLRTGDHILQIGDVNVRGMGSEQVALVLRQSGSQVRLVVARSVLEAPQFQIPHAPIIPTHQLDQHMEHFNAVMAMESGEQDIDFHNLHLQHQLQQYQLQHQTMLGSVQVHPQPLEVMPNLASVDVFELALMKDSKGLGITIAGYVGGDNTPDEISGIFVKSVTEGGPADVDGRVRVNDQIIEVDGKSLQGFTNQQAIEVLRNTGQMVRLKLVRFHHGPKFEKLQEYLAQTNQPVLVQPSTIRDVTLGNNLTCEQFDLQDNQVFWDDYSGEIPPEVEAAIRASWEPIVGNDFWVIVAQLAKFKEAGGLGISLEGTVDVEDGVEVRPHHYIRSILPDGPVGLNRRLKSSDELLEVNGKRLLGLNHVNVVDILKDLPQHVRLVCARRKTPLPDPFSQPELQISATLPLHPGSNPLTHWSERLVKAKSEVTLSTSDPAFAGSLQKPRSRSLEPMTSLAMWSSQPVVIELEKAEKGLGFSIFDYQDPVNPSEKVIVIRSLVPGGVAQVDGRLLPGDRLMSVNSVNLENATQVQAVQALKAAARGMVKIGVAKPLLLTALFKNDSKLSPVLDSSKMPFSKSPLGAQVSLSSHDAGITDSSALKRRATTELPFTASETVAVLPEKHLSSGQSLAYSQADHKLGTSLGDLCDSKDLKPLNSSQNLGPLDHSLVPLDTFSNAKDVDFKNKAIDSSLDSKSDLDSFLEPSKVKAEDAVLEESMIALEFVDAPELNHVSDTGIILHTIHDDKPYQTQGDTQSSIVFNGSRRFTSSSKEARVNDPHENNLPNAKDIHGPSRTVQSVDKSNVVVESYGTTVIDVSTVNIEYGHDLVRQNKSAKPSKDVKTETATLTIAAPIAKFDSTEFESHQEKPHPLRVISPPPPKKAPTPPLTPPLRPAPCSPKRDPKIHGRPGIRQRKTSSTSSPEHITSSDLTTPPSSPRSVYSGYASPELTRVSASLERTIVIHKSHVHLGLTVDTVDNGVNGCVVKDIAKPSSVGHDGRICPGDYIVAINNESLRRATHAQARAILRRSSLIGCDITITYIPGQAVDKYQQADGQASRTQQSPQKMNHQLKSENSPVSMTTEPPQSSVNEVQKGNQPARQASTSEFKAGIISGQKTLQTDGSFAVGNQVWGPPRIVQLTRDPGKSLGISIVGGRVDMFNVSQEHSNAGIFIKQVLADSPAGRNGTLKKGDRILEVSGCDVRNATHDEAVEVIRNSSCPITFVVQSLSYSSCPKDPETMPAKTPQSSNKLSQDDESCPTLSPEHMQQVFENTSMSIPDSESEDELNSTKKRVQKKYLDLPGTLQLVDVNRGTSNLGIGLAGNKDRCKMSVFVAGIQPESSAARDGRIQVGDEILEVNGISLHGLSHLNASAVIKGVNSPILKLLIHRRDDFLSHMAVRPLRYSTSTHFDTVLPLSPRGSADTTSSSNSHQESSATSYSHSSGAPDLATTPSSAQSLVLADTIQVITLDKPTSQGLGFGISEETKNGRHGIFVISITLGGVADKGQQLEVGDEILEVGDKSFVGLPYDKAIDFLRSAQGLVRLKVCKANPVNNFVNSTTASPGKPQKKIHISNTLGESSTDRLDSTENANPRTCPIALGKHTNIEIEKGKMRLGLGIVGGSDTLLNAVIIHEIYEGGAASRDGRLKIGDQLLEVNGEDLMDATHARVLQVLSQTPSVIKMVVYRDDRRSLEDAIYDVILVDLVRRPGKGLGLSIMGKKNGAGVYISDVVKGGVADADERLMHGDQILAVNGEDVKNATHEYAASVLKTILGKVSLSIGRLKASSKASSRNYNNHGTSLKKSESSASSKLKSRHAKSIPSSKSY